MQRLGRNRAPGVSRTDVRATPASLSWSDGWLMVRAERNTNQYSEVSIPETNICELETTRELCVGTMQVTRAWRVLGQ